MIKSKTNQTYSYMKLCAALLLVLLVLTPGVLFAEGGSGGSGSGSGGSSGGGSSIQGAGDQDQTRDQDRIQDPTTHDGDEPDQDRDRLQDRDRIHVDSPQALQQFILEEQAYAESDTDGLVEDVREIARNRNRVQVAVMALMASENVLGQFGQQISDLAQQIASSTQAQVRAEEQIQNRSRLTRFFFGGDKEAVEQIQTQTRQATQNIERIQQYLNNCDCEESVRLMLQEQIQNMIQEQARLQQKAEEEESAWGLFSWRF